MSAESSGDDDVITTHNNYVSVIFSKLCKVLKELNQGVTEKETNEEWKVDILRSSILVMLQNGPSTSSTSFGN